jgi:hypothetical protein
VREMKWMNFRQKLKLEWLMKWPIYFPLFSSYEIHYIPRSSMILYGGIVVGAGSFSQKLFPLIMMSCHGPIPKFMQLMTRMIREFLFPSRLAPVRLPIQNYLN